MEEQKKLLEQIEVEADKAAGILRHEVLKVADNDNLIDAFACIIRIQSLSKSSLELQQ